MQIEQYIKNELHSYHYDDFWIDRYIKFLEWRMNVRTLDDQEYFEVHHIVPRSWNKLLKNDPNNKIRLTYREHIIAHHMLMKTGDRKMGTALNIIIGKGSYKQSCKSDIRAWMLKLEEQAVAEHKNKLKIPVVDLKTGNVYPSANDADRAFGLRLGTISTAIYGKCLTAGTFWMRQSDMNYDHKYYYDLYIKERQEIARKSSLTNAKQIINMNTHKMYDSVSLAAKDIGVSPDTLSGAVRKKIKCKSCYWMYVSDITKPYDQELKDLQSITEQRYKRKMISVHDLTTNIKYESLMAAAKSINTSDTNLRSCIKRQKPCKNHYFIYA